MSDSLSPAAVTLAGLTTASLVKYVASAWISSRAVSHKDFEYVGTVKELNVYPVKSLRGLSVQTAKSTTLGLHYGGVGDRNWVIRTADGGYVTQRQEPSLALVRTRLQDDKLLLDAPGMDTLDLPIHPQIVSTMMKEVQIKTDVTPCLDCGDKAGSWVDQYLKRKGLRIVFCPPDTEKRDAINAKKLWEHNAKEGDLLAFQDYCGYMLMTTSSLDALNQKLTKKVTMHPFRPNIVVDGPPAFDEDRWTEVRIGNSTFRTIDMCTRCIFTTVDQETGIKSKDEEPLKTLKTFRVRPPYNPKPVLGIHLAMDTSDHIKVGDKVYVKRQ
ncbi:hypothetical protein FSP39_011655 [Pinctada imbricata]|uniref:MOSC domain-containing protein n=1 Tax=Pinctada imbricata TaxID=66713 RepID=A0AA88Y691_PINIB|nr:hypothetical protein FSP39_011655 [Pinctada imbricata]